MVDLVNLLQFANNYYYTTHEDYILFKDYLDNVVYENGVVYIDAPVISDDVDVEQESSIIYDGNNLLISFNYLPLEQTVRVKIDGEIITENLINREIDTLIINNVNTLNMLNITVSRYTDDTGIIYKGFEKTVKTVFDVITTSIYYDSEWVLMSDYSFDITDLVCSNNVTLTDYTDSSRNSYCIVNFPNNNPVSFTITKEDDSGYEYFITDFELNNNNEFSMRIHMDE